MIPFVNLSGQYRAYREEIDQAISEILDSGFPIGGPAVETLERTLAADFGCGRVAACANGTDALSLSLKALGLKPGDEVIVPDYTFIATAETVALEGGIPRFADVGKDFLISPDSVEALVNEKTVGIVAVDLFGQCAPYPALEKIARRHGLWILEDAAQGIGSSQNGKFAGSFGNIAAASFYPTKPFGAYGDGGAVMTKDKDLADRVRIFAGHGKSNGRYEFLGGNSRLDAVQAAVLLVKRRHLNEEISRRRQNAKIYDGLFAEFEGFSTPSVADGNVCIFAQYPVCTKARDEIVQKISAAGVPTRIYYERPLSAEPCFQKFPTAAEDFRKNVNARRLSKESFCLPICAFSDAEEIAVKIRSALKNASSP